MPKVIRVERALTVQKRKKKVAAYARISMESERMNHSLSAQISYYSSLIQKNPEWQYAGVFVDDAISGTRIAKRDEFQRMIETADKGEIDIILTKSIQRFARNTVDLLKVVRHLKDSGVEVRFEREHINSMSGDGELMLTILASFAQEESRSISENTRWAIQKKYQQGIPHSHFRVYGYHWKGDEMVIVPEEAALVRRMYQGYLDGKSPAELAREFTAEGITTRRGQPWTKNNIMGILKNMTYTGNLLLQKVFTVDPISKKHKVNRGQLPQYYVENTHPAIISQTTYDTVQKELAKLYRIGALAQRHLNRCCFTAKIKCPSCGMSYRHVRLKNRNLTEYWVCGSQKTPGGRCQVGGAINHKDLKRVCSKVLGLDKFDEEVFLARVDYINVPKRHVLEFHMKDGSVITEECVNMGNKDRWTPEARARASVARKKVLEQKRKEWEANAGKKSNGDTRDHQPVHGHANKQHKETPCCWICPRFNRS